MPAFIPYASRLTDLLKSSYVNDSDSRIYPKKMLYCFYMNSTPRRSKIGICDYVRTNSDDFSPNNNIPLIVFAMDNPENIVKAIKGEKIGTLVK